MSKRNFHRRLDRKDLSKALAVLSIIFLLIGAFGLLISQWEKKQYRTEGGESTVDVDTVFSDAEEITVNGKTYVNNRRVRSYLIMGADSYGEPVSRTSGGQADTQVLVVIDDANKTWRLLPIDRDTMVMMDIRDSEDNVIAMTKGQITLAHAYGTWETGARYTSEVVSKLLGNQKINGYFSMNLDALPVLNDAVGGVTVTVTTDFTDVDDSLVLGEEITLNGEQAEHFVRSRMTVDDGTNEARMARQEAYLKGLIKAASKLDDSAILDLYDQLINNSVTNLGSGDFLELTELTKEYTQLDNIRIEGEHTINNGHIEFYPDDESLQNAILELFYTAKEN